MKKRKLKSLLILLASSEALKLIATVPLSVAMIELVAVEREAVVPRLPKTVDSLPKLIKPMILLMIWQLVGRKIAEKNRT